jgi:hypothetical protein
MASKKTTPSDFRRVLDTLVRGGHDHRRIFDAFVRFAACALACQTREAEYLEEAKRWKPEEMKLFSEAFAALVNEMGDEPFQDVLGVHYMDWALSAKGAQHGGEFHTPPALCEAIALMTFSVETVEAAVADHGVCTISEPACGAGAMVLAAAKVLADAGRGDLIRKLRVQTIDVNRTACDMCYVNLTLWGIPCEVVHGNALSLQVWGRWRNIHYAAPWLPLAVALDNQAPTTPDAAETITTPQRGPAPLAIPATAPAPKTKRKAVPPVSVQQLLFADA